MQENSDYECYVILRHDILTKDFQYSLDYAYTKQDQVRHGIPKLN